MIFKDIRRLLILAKIKSEANKTSKDFCRLVEYANVIATEFEQLEATFPVAPLEKKPIIAARMEEITTKLEKIDTLTTMLNQYMFRLNQRLLEFR